MQFQSAQKPNAVFQVLNKVQSLVQTVNKAVHFIWKIDRIGFISVMGGIGAICTAIAQDSKKRAVDPDVKAWVDDSEKFANKLRADFFIGAINKLRNCIIVSGISMVLCPFALLQISLNLLQWLLKLLIGSEAKADKMQSLLPPGIVIQKQKNDIPSYVIKDIEKCFDLNRNQYEPAIFIEEAVVEVEVEHQVDATDTETESTPVVQEVEIVVVKDEPLPEQLPETEVIAEVKAETKTKSKALTNTQAKNLLSSLAVKGKTAENRKKFKAVCTELDLTGWGKLQSLTAFAAFLAASKVSSEQLEQAIASVKAS